MICIVLYLFRCQSTQLKCEDGQESINCMHDWAELGHECDAYPSKEPQMVETREIAHVNVVLWTIANFVTIHVEIVLAVDGNLAGRFRNDPTDHRHGCRFSRTIMSQ